MDRESLSRVMYLTNTDVISETNNQCHVCLNETTLTKEHVPQKSAFNDCTSLWERLYTPPKSKASASRVNIRGGFRVRTLCQPCNSELCSGYASEYVKFVRHIVESPQLFDGWGSKRIISLQCDTLMVAKEIAAMILAVEPLAFAKHCSDLRNFVLNPTLRFKPAFDVFAFLVPDVPEAGTVSRMHGRVDCYAPRFGMIGGEISRFPFGFVFAHNLGEGYDHSTLTNITHWFHQEHPSATVSLASRLTGIESIKCGVGSQRSRPQIDYV